MLRGVILFDRTNLFVEVATCLTIVNTWMGLCSVHDELLHELDVGLGDLLRVGQNLGHQNWHTNLETKRNTSFLKPFEAWNNQKQNIDHYY